MVKGSVISAVLGLGCILLINVFQPDRSFAQDVTNTGTNMIEDVDEVQGELSNADVPLTQLQWLEILESNTVANGQSGLPATDRFEGYVGWRQQWTSLTNGSWTARMNLEAMGVHLRLRQIHRSQGISESGGFFVYTNSNLSVGVGDFGINHGFGLLKTGPGRGAYLAADSKLGLKGQGVRRWAGGYDSGAVRGGTVQWKSHYWDALVVIGSVRATGETETSFGLQEKMIRLGGHAKDNQWGVLVASSGKDMGVSLTGSKTGKRLHGSVEVAGWKAGQEVQPAFAWAMEVGLEPLKNWILEGIVVATDGAGIFTGGHLPYIPAGEDGRGWFLRTGRRISRKGQLLLVVGKMGHRTPTGTGQRHQSTLLDLQGRWLPQAGIEISGRWRRRQRKSEKWSAIYPWQPPHLAAQELRSVLTCQINCKFNPVTTRIMARLYQQGKNAAWGTRSLITFSVVYWLDSSSAIQGSNTTSWGDPIDLVSALSPMAGLVLPRHWGSWREETTLGFRFEWGFFQGRLGFSRRVPENYNTDEVQTSIWANGSIRW